MAKQEEGFDPPAIKELTVENVNDAINKMSEIINLLLSEVRKLRQESDTDAANI